MKVYVSADIEGVAGIAHWDEATLGHAAYARFREQMQREVRAACEGAVTAGATEVLVKDAHATGRNLDPRDLPREARLIRGWSGHPLAMIQELDGSCAALCLVGYHACGGSAGNPLAHTFSSSRVWGITLNGRPASEFLLHAHAAAELGVPTCFVSGDAELCDEVAEVLPAARTVASMRGVGTSVVARHPDAVVEEIRSGVEAALGGDPSACRLRPPERYTLEVSYKTPVEAYKASFYPGAELTSPATVAFSSDRMLEVLRMILFTVRSR